MAHGSELTAVVFGLASAATWGVGDFSGGLATRRAPLITVTLLSQTCGLVLLGGLAVARAETLPSARDAILGSLAGLLGLVGLLGLYQAMAIGQMAIAAPVTAVLAASLPVVVGALTQGVPDLRRLLGFVLALTGLWCISRPRDGGGRPAGLGLALAAGLGFGGFLVCIAQVQVDAVLWPLAAARAAAITPLLALALIGPRLRRPANSALGLIGLAGAMDASGNAFFVLSEHAGRLDVAGALASLYPATTVLLALWILRERLTRLQGVGILLTLMSVALIAG